MDAPGGRNGRRAGPGPPGPGAFGNGSNLSMHVHQHLHLHILAGIVAEVRAVPPAHSASGPGISPHAPRTAGRTSGRAPGGLARLDGGFALGESAIPPGLLPLPVAGPPGRALPSAAAEPSTPHAARDFTREVLRQWDLCVIYPDAAVVVSELVTNALCYGARVAAPPPDSDRGPVDLTLWQRASYLDLRGGRRQPGAAGAPGGRPHRGGRPGLQVVQALSSSWGWTMLGGRQKAVWAALSLVGAAAAARPGPRPRTRPCYRSSPGRGPAGEAGGQGGRQGGAGG